MSLLSAKEREILRQLAYKKQTMATSPENNEILKKWFAQSTGQKYAPIVGLMASNFMGEVVAPRLQCESDTARSLEWSLLASMAGRELFGDDTPLYPEFLVDTGASVDPFGVKSSLKHADKTLGFHIEPVTDDLEKDFGLFLHGSFDISNAHAIRLRDAANEVFGDILPARLSMNALCAPMTNPLVMLIGLENMYTSMYDCPEAFKAVMESACSTYEKAFDALEASGLLLPTNGLSCLPQESFCLTDELPSDKVTSTKQMWGFLECQEFTAASPEMYAEFVRPYMDRLVSRFGLLSYGCCERVDNLLENYLLKWDNLRKLSVSPFNDQHKVGDLIRGRRIVFYSKPRAELLTNPGPLDEDAVINSFKYICEAASGCMLEMNQREAGTIYSDPTRGRRYIELAKATADKYWKP